MLNTLASELAPIVHAIFTQSLDTGELPRDWSSRDCQPRSCNISETLALRLKLFETNRAALRWTFSILSLLLFLCGCQTSQDLLAIYVGNPLTIVSKINVWFFFTKLLTDSGRLKRRTSSRQLAPVQGRITASNSNISRQIVIHFGFPFFKLLFRAGTTFIWALRRLTV